MISQNNRKTKSFSKEYLEYSNYLKTLDIVEDSRDWRLKHIRGFVNYLKEKNILIEDLTAIDVYDYMTSMDKLKPRTKENRARCIRLFLNFLFDTSKIKISGEQVFPKIINTRYSTTPSNYTNEELIKVINSVNRDIKLGKRDYAVLLIFITYGIRLKDLINLTFENINWNDKKIIIRQQKDNEINEFPLTEEIRYAIIDYLKSERPKSDLSYIFLTVKGTKLSSGGCYDIIDKYFKKSGIEIGNRHHGPHSLRHSLAKSLLDDGNGIKAISEILGHNQIETTLVYERINFKELKKLSLEVPAWNK